MKNRFLIAALGGLLLAGPAASLASAQHAVAPLAQPASEAAPTVPAGDLALGSVRVPRKVMANGQPLAAGTYQLRLTGTGSGGQRARRHAPPTSATSSSFRAAR